MKLKFLFQHFQIRSIVVVLPLLVCFLAGAARAEKMFAIGNEPIGKALYLFAQQAGISIARPPLSFRDGKSQGLTGRYNIGEGLEHLLRGTGFGFNRVSSRSVRIFKLPLRPQKTKIKTSLQKEIAPVINEILVSATRRKNYVQSLPYAISAISGQRSVDLGSISTHDVTHQVAGIYATGEGVGRDKVIVRGLSDGPFSGRVQSLVSTYLDYTRLTFNAPDPGLMLYDIDRIEVLRGPQGTLYGSGALGGLYRIVSREPSLEESEFEVSSSMAFTRSGDPSTEVSTVVNLPMTGGTSALRVLAYYRNDGGYIDDIRLGIDNVNRESTSGGRFALKVQPGNKWSLTLSTSYQRLESDDSNYFNGSLSRLQRDNYIREPRRDEFFKTGAKLYAEFGWGEIVSATSWLNRKIDQVIDASPAVPFLTGLENRPSPFTIDRDIEAITNETHISSVTGEKTEWLFGIFGSHRLETVVSSLIVPGANEFEFFNETDQVYLERLEDRLNEIALFGEITYYLSKNFFVTAGGRWFHYDDTALSDLDDIGSVSQFRATGEQKKSGFTPKFLMTYHFSDAGLLYAQYAQGYRVGGINLAGLTPIEVFDLPNGEPVPPLINEENPFLVNFSSDKISNYELGLKNTLFDGKMTVNAAGFYAAWSKIQSYQYGYNGFPEVANVGDAHIYGLELEVLYKPSYRSELQMNISWNSSKITATNSSFGAQVGRSLPGAPSFLLGLSGRRDFQLFGLQASIGADYAYVGSADLLFNKLISPRMDAYHLTNMRLTLFTKKWQFTIYVNNILDGGSNIFAFGNPFALAGFPSGGIVDPGSDFGIEPLEQLGRTNQHTPLRPRTVGLRARWQF